MVRIVLKCFILALAMVIVTVSQALAAPDSCFSGICLDNKSNEATVSQRLGPATRWYSKIDEKWYMTYTDRGRSLSIQFGFESAKGQRSSSLDEIFVTSTFSEDAASPAAIEEGRTESGVSLGDSGARLRALKGPPTRVVETKTWKHRDSRHTQAYGALVYVYEVDGEALTNFFYINKDRVAAIWINDSE